MQSSTYRFSGIKLWVAATLSAALLELPFPLAGPMPIWRTAFAWFALVPLLAALLAPASTSHARPLRHAFLLAWFCGILWYSGNCYWIYETMRIHGGLSPLISALLLLGFSLILGVYFGFFGLALALLRKATGNTRLALAAAPFLWTALELAASRITCVPWDQLGYSQVDNALVNQLAPFTGVYGISFVLVAVNAVAAGALLLTRSTGRRICACFGALLLAAGALGVTLAPPQSAPQASAVLIQPNLDVAADNRWAAPGEWDQHIAEFARLAAQQCKTYLAGIPETRVPTGEILCPPYPTHPSLIVWPEAPSPFDEQDPRFRQAMQSIAAQNQSPLVVGNIGEEFSADDQQWQEFNSALVFSADGARLGRYDKIHLVPFGEYIPFQRLLTFAHKLTGRVSVFTPGHERKVFRLNGRRYGVFICYESVFADEVRQFAQLGAEVMVNISDDGWYGDTSAPWQHLNMARMRAIENRRWILRATNNGITAAIDPYGRVRQSIPRHSVDALPAEFGFNSELTFYTTHGDEFAWACLLLALGMAAWAGKQLR